MIAIKESSGNLEKVMQMIREVKHGFQVLVGSAPTLWPSLLMGACGAILAYANAAPYSVIAIWEAYRTREEAAGLDWQNRIGTRVDAGDDEVRRPGLEVRDGPERLLRRSAAPAAVRADGRGEAGDRRGVSGFEGLSFNAGGADSSAARILRRPHTYVSAKYTNTVRRPGSPRRRTSGHPGRA